jgi:biotin operon repressor
MTRQVPTSLLPELADILADGPLSTRELAKRVGLRRNTVRHHLRQGRDHFFTLLKRRSDGKKVWRKKG